MSDCRRAVAIGGDAAAYIRTWRGVYEWLLERMRHAERQAALELHETLRREAA
ncbi:hypothetical protein [Xylella taiwanensis]